VHVWKIVIIDIELTVVYTCTYHSNRTMTIVSGTCSDRAVQVCLPVGQKLKITLNDKCGYIECFSIPQLFAEKTTVR